MVANAVALGILLVLAGLITWWVNHTPNYHDLCVQRIKRLELLFPVGSIWPYLGRDCCVTGHWKWTYSSYDCQAVPRLFADYADNHGVIHTITFSWAEALALALVTE